VVAGGGSGGRSKKRKKEKTCLSVREEKGADLQVHAQTRKKFLAIVVDYHQ